MIDAHQHVWEVGKNGQEWPGPDLAPIHRNFSIDDWRTAATPLGFTGSVLVQSQPNEEDSRWLLEVAAREPTVRAVVGWSDLKAADAVDKIRGLSGHRKLKGLRPMLQALDVDWISDPALDPAVSAMIAHDLRFDALVYPRHLPHLRTFAERWPKLPIVIDHGAKPGIAAGEMEPWRSEIAKLAALPNVWCKLSGLFTEMGDGQDRAAALPYVRALCDLFGPERLMWGSDWPVLLLAASVEDWFRFSSVATGSDEAGLVQLFGGTAARFYGLEH